MVSTVVTGPEFTLRLRHRFTADREKVFAAWTTPEALKRWWCPPGWVPRDIRVDLRVGGSFMFSMQRESGAEVITAHGTFLIVIVPSTLAYTWNWQGAFPNMPETCVTVEFHDISGRTEVTLRHEDLSMRVCAHHLSGWMQAFTRFDRVYGDCRFLI